MLGYSLEVLRRGASNEHHNICFRGEIRKILCGYSLLSAAILAYGICYKGIMFFSFSQYLLRPSKYPSFRPSVRTSDNSTFSLIRTYLRRLYLFSMWWWWWWGGGGKMGGGCERQLFQDCFCFFSERESTHKGINFQILSFKSRSF